MFRPDFLFIPLYSREYRPLYRETPSNGDGATGNEVDDDGDGVTGNEVDDDGDGTTGDDNDDDNNGGDNDDGEGDGALGSGATGYDKRWRRATTTISTAILQRQ